MRIKRIAVLFAMTCVVAVSLCSCGEKKNVDANSVKTAQNFESSATFEYGDFAFEAVVKRDMPGSCLITVTSPEAIKGMAFTYREDELEISYLGMNVKVDPNSALSRAAISATVKALDAVTRQNGVSVSFDKGKFYVSGESQSGSFTLTLDGKNGNYLTLEMPDIPMKVTFNNFKLLS